MEIIKAKRQSLHDICELIRESITKLCAADHADLPQHLDAWLAVRSAQKLAPVLFNRESQAFCCLDGTRMVGVVHIEQSGRLGLCYVHPQYTGQGIGHRLLETAELQASEWGLTGVTLVSTATAREFYLAHGYEQYAEPILYIGMPGYPLKKNIRPR